jgi:hypothetical protein
MFPFLLRLQWLKVSGFVRCLFVVPLSTPHPKGFHPISITQLLPLRKEVAVLCRVPPCVRYTIYFGYCLLPETCVYRYASDLLSILSKQIHTPTGFRFQNSTLKTQPLGLQESSGWVVVYLSLISAMCGLMDCCWSCQELLYGFLGPLTVTLPSNFCFGVLSAIS